MGRIPKPSALALWQTMKGHDCTGSDDCGVCSLLESACKLLEACDEFVNTILPEGTSMEARQLQTDIAIILQRYKEQIRDLNIPPKGDTRREKS